MELVARQKQVLIVNASPLFREFIKEKLSQENVLVENVQGGHDAFIKLVNLLPDLIIIDIESSFTDLMEFLQRKYSDINAKRIPIIISGPKLEKSKTTYLVQFGVIKYFTKPIKFDSFFEAVGKVLNINLYIDSTQCILEIHHNGNIIFIEIAQGLNREKIALLKYKIKEMIDKNNLRTPKVVLMMTNFSLTFMDGINIELLLDAILSDERILKRNVKILSFDPLITKLIEGHSAYNGIKVIQNLAEDLDTIIDETEITGTKATDIIENTFLSQKNIDTTDAVQMRFNFDTGKNQGKNTDGNIFNIAVVDDDSVIRTILQQTFSTIGVDAVLFDNGKAFIDSLKTTTYDLAIIDIFMEGFTGFDILNILQSQQLPVPTIIYSQATRREFVVQALTLGAKSYLAKPQKPETIIQKAMEVLHDKANNQ